jgi:hypothetical protein
MNEPPDHRQVGKSCKQAFADRLLVGRRETDFENPWFVARGS